MSRHSHFLNFNASKKVDNNMKSEIMASLIGHQRMKTKLQPARVAASCLKATGVQTARVGFFLRVAR
jgi:hypothetical protein